jgi:hypothetical protein
MEKSQFVSKQSKALYNNQLQNNTFSQQTRLIKLFKGLEHPKQAVSEGYLDRNPSYILKSKKHTKRLYSTGQRNYFIKTIK